jgi:RNA polymerase sigma factor (sigma-70 family)
MTSVDVSIEAEQTVASSDFDAFYRANYVAIVRLCRALCRDHEAAADVAQDAFVIARRKWTEMAGVDRPDLWVRRVAINRAISWHRRAGAEARAIARLQLPRAAAPPEEPSEMWALVRRLPQRQAQMVALVYVDDLTVEQAAHTLEISVSSAKTHLQRARRALAAAISVEEER